MYMLCIYCMLRAVYELCVGGGGGVISGSCFLKHTREWVSSTTGMMIE